MKYTTVLLALVAGTSGYGGEDYYDDEPGRPHRDYPSNEKDIFFFGREGDDNYDPDKTEGELGRLEYLWVIDEYV